MVRVTDSVDAVAALDVSSAKMDDKGTDHSAMAGPRGSICPARIAPADYDAG
jgi:hypothetical protein